MITKHKLAAATIAATSRTASLELLKHEIAGATIFHHTLAAGREMKFAALGHTARICLLVEGESTFVTDGEEYSFKERAAFVPDYRQDLTVKATGDTQMLEIQWRQTAYDLRELETYKTKFPLIQPYWAAKQYRDKNKSDKTISRVVIEQRNIPRFCMGSVESYGFDRVAPHPHPTLDQLFFSFPENNLELLIDGERMPMGGNVLLHIPLGSDHGVEVAEGNHLHYMWIDFILDETGMTRLDTSHIATGTMRSFANEK